MKQKLLDTEPKNQPKLMESIQKKQDELVQAYSDMTTNSSEDMLSPKTIASLEIATQMLTKGDVTVPKAVMDKVQEDVDNFHKVLETGLDKVQEQLDTKLVIAENEIINRDIPQTYAGLERKVELLNDKELPDKGKAALATYEHQKQVVERYAKKYNLEPEEAYQEIISGKHKDRLDDNTPTDEVQLHQELEDVQNFSTAINQGIVDMKFRKRLESKFQDDIINQYKLTEETDYQAAYNKLKSAGLIC